MPGHRCTIGGVVRVRIEPAGRELGLEPGERLLDALDEAAQGVLALGCRDASCGVCRVAVVAGGEGLEPAGPEERRTLGALGSEPGERLGCQLRASAAVGNIVLRVRPSPCRSRYQSS